MGCVGTGCCGVGIRSGVGIEVSIEVSIRSGVSAFSRASF